MVGVGGVERVVTAVFFGAVAVGALVISGVLSLTGVRSRSGPGWRSAVPSEALTVTL